MAAVPGHLKCSVVRCLGLNPDIEIGPGAGLQQVWAVSECSSLRPRKVHICVKIPNVTSFTNALHHHHHHPPPPSPPPHVCHLCRQVPAGVPPDGGSPLAAQQQWQWWQLCGAAVALMAVAVPMFLLWLQSLGLLAAWTVWRCGCSHYPAR